MADKITLHSGDSAEVLKQYPDNHFDSIVTDPPYGIEFLGKEWDKNTGAIEVWQECLRVLKPGGHILAFSAARTYHRLATNLEDVGFEIRDQIMWIYGSGFPKGQDMGKIIEKREGKRANSKSGDIIVNKKGGSQTNTACNTCGKTSVQIGIGFNCSTEECEMKEKIRPADNEWAGWKTGLKPAHEPIVMARKPFKGSTVDNVLKHGTGAINIHDTRVGDEEVKSIPNDQTFHSKQTGEVWLTPNETTNIGRYPSNVIGEIEGEEQKYFYKPELTEEEVHNPIVMARKPFKGSTVDNVLKHGTGAINIDDTRVEVTDTQTFANNSVGYKTVPEDKRSGDNIYGFKKQDADEPIQTPQGRYPANVIMSEEEGKEEYKKYYYCPKVSRKERSVGDITNNHPTVKPVALMKYLVTLVTPKEGKVLDPFNGSGSTGMAVKEFGGEYVGIDLNPDYIEIANRRITAWSSGE